MIYSLYPLLKVVSGISLHPLEKDPGCVPQFKIAIFIHFKTTIDMDLSQIFRHDYVEFLTD